MTTPTVPRPTVAPRSPRWGLSAWATRTQHAANDGADVRDEHWINTQGPDTQIPPEALQACQASDPNAGTLPLSPDLQSLLAGAVRLGETVAEQRSYEAGYADGARGQWRWGALCGALGVLVLMLLAIAAGAASGVLS